MEIRTPDTMIAVGDNEWYLNSLATDAARGNEFEVVCGTYEFCFHSSTDLVSITELLIMAE